MTWLAAGAKQRAAVQLHLRNVDRLERLILLGQLIHAIGRLHKLGWVFGDVSLRNAVFALDPPRVLLLDCDGAASLSNPARQQPNTPFWFPPEISQRSPAPAGRPHRRLQARPGRPAVHGARQGGHDRHVAGRAWPTSSTPKAPGSSPGRWVPTGASARRPRSFTTTSTGWCPPSSCRRW